MRRAGDSVQFLTREELEAEVACLRKQAAEVDRARRRDAIFESAVDFAIVVTDPRGLITDWNNGAELTMGWSADEMIGQTADRVFTLEDRAGGRVDTEMSIALRNGVATDERWHLRKDGSRFWASGEMMPLRGDGGTHQGFVKILRDRTRQREAGERLRASEERFATLLETIETAFAIIEVKFDANDRPVDYRFLEANPAFERQAGINLRGKWVTEFAPDLERFWFETYGHVARTGEPATFESYAEAFGRWFDVRAIRVGEPAERQIAVLFDDVTARKHAENELRKLNETLEQQVEIRSREIIEQQGSLRESERMRTQLGAQTKLLQTITDNVGQAIFQMDGNGMVTFANPAAVAMFGFSTEEMLGRCLHDLLHHTYPDGAPYPADQCDLRHALRDGQLLVESPQVFFRKDGTRRCVQVTIAPVTTEGGVRSAVLTVADVTERRAAEAKLAESEAYWRGLFERLHEGLVLGEVVRNAEGVVTDWRYLSVNSAWADLVGMPVTAAIGRTFREVWPDVQDEWISEPGHVVDTGETISFTRQAASNNRWYEGRVSKLGGEAFIILFLDVTDRILSERVLADNAKRRAALARLGDLLRTAGDAGAMGYTAGAIVGPILGASQAGYASIDAAKETVEVDATWCAAGVASIAGRHSFREYGSYIDDLKAGRVVAIADVRDDDRTRHRAGALVALGVVALVNVPVVEHGEVVATLLVLFDAPRTFTKEELDFLRAAVDRTRAGIARVRAEEQQAILNNELSHRLKNSMAMIQAIANQTLKQVTDRDAVKSFEQRLMALSTAHDVLLQKDWETASLEEVLRRVLDTAGAGGRYDASGPPVNLGARAALSTSLLLHELATNASKYGALTNASGKVEVRWYVVGDGKTEEVVLDWRETGGPPALEPTRKGFGSRLLRMGLVGTGGSQIDYRETGLAASFRASVKHVEQAG